MVIDRDGSKSITREDPTKYYSKRQSVESFGTDVGVNGAAGGLSMSNFNSQFRQSSSNAKNPYNNLDSRANMAIESH